MDERLEIHRCTIQRFLQEVYERPIIGNVERGAYVECMIELALSKDDSAWHLTEPWTGWDLEHRKTGARIQIKQSAALQRWNPCVRGAPGTGTEAEPKPRFSIKPYNGYYSEDGTWTPTEPPQRQADLYVFAWHPKKDASADHRRSDQWKFFLVAEKNLPPVAEPPRKSQQTIGLAWLSDAQRRHRVVTCDYDALAAMVVEVLEPLRSR